jgi:hypothetical protein
MKPNLSNSIYQTKGSGAGLTVKDGMLINNRPDGVTGIAAACSIKKAMKKAEEMEEATMIGRAVSGFSRF